ncbi:hypothetical protein TNIN_186971 [Trichonephila inaurata madagascariensis]|uniref:Uncharacterized protein n=1 Tax=Trichonephila inaurata madagascariensis TaxID=2747483 RepID=A0A8X6ILH2_9ARAC|nr:hypothetical protein TNIN_186971 [Trichonephila inaurata madagascariensis]
MDENARSHKTGQMDEYLETEVIQKREYSARSPILNNSKHFWKYLGRAIDAPHFLPRTVSDLTSTAVEEEYHTRERNFMSPLASPKMVDCMILLALKQLDAHP